MRLCELIDQLEWSRDDRFATNAARVIHRDALIALLEPLFALRRVDEWLSTLEAADIPCGPINTLEEVFAEPQVSAREMLVTMEHPTIGDLPLVGSPLKFSQTPVQYRLPPPRLGEHTEKILREILGKD
jgi:crotonobetainyl-CoA:carnitine CoA-transferase CaiB-like acyl-CoA transferase